jgi:hypothetical protein
MLRVRKGGIVTVAVYATLSRIGTGSCLGPTNATLWHTGIISILAFKFKLVTPRQISYRKVYYVGFEILTVVVKKFVTFWGHLLACWFLARLIFDPEDGGDTLLQNVGLYMNYTAPYPRRWQLSYS